MVFRSNSKKKNVNAKTTTFRKCLLWIRLWLVSKSILKPRCVIFAKDLFSGTGLKWGVVVYQALLDQLNFDSIPVNVVLPVTAAPERPRRERRNVPGAGRS